MRPFALLAPLAFCSTLLFAADLSAYRSTYEKEVQAIVLNHATNCAKLDAQYAKAVEDFRMRATRAGDLERAQAAIGEQERFARDPTVDESRINKRIPDLEAIQQSHIRSSKALQVFRARQIASLAGKYDAALARLQVELTKQNRIDDAVAVRNERESLAREVDSSAAGPSGAQTGGEGKPAGGSGTAPKAGIEPAVTGPHTEVGSRNARLAGVPKKEWTFLADVEPAKASVGYSKLSRFKKGGEGLGIGEKQFETAILAHASSSITYELEGKYEELSTSYGMQNGAGGSAVFHVILDGEEKFRSDGMWSYGATKAKGHKPVTINISGGKVLELKTVGVRGGAGAWSAWGDPRIR